MRTEMDCYWSPGDDGHSLCPHPHYCIFNQNRYELEKQMMDIRKQLKVRKRELSALKENDRYCDSEYEEVTRDIRILNDDLNQLKMFKKKIMNKEVKGYGVETSMEFETVSSTKGTGENN